MIKIINIPSRFDYGAGPGGVAWYNDTRKVENAASAAGVRRVMSSSITWKPFNSIAAVFIRTSPRHFTSFQCFFSVHRRLNVDKKIVLNINFWVSKKNQCADEKSDESWMKVWKEVA